MMRRQLLPALGMVLTLTVITGLIYPLAVTGIAQTTLSDEANGSLVVFEGEPVGSRWIGQQFAGDEYFHPRPSATGYAPGPDYAHGSNLGPTSDSLLYGEDDPATSEIDESETTGVDDLVRIYRERNGLEETAPVPVDAVTGSSSSLDPHISIANARLQARRVADARGIALDEVLARIKDNTDQRALGFLGEPGVNVLLLNLALDSAG